MRLIKRNDVYQLETISPTGKRIRKSLRTKDRHTAEAKASQALQGATMGQGPNVHLMSLTEALGHSESTIWATSKDWRSRASVIKTIKRSLGHLQLHEVTYSTLVSYATKCTQEGLAPATTNRRLSCIRTALNEQVKMGQLATLPPAYKLPENNRKDLVLSRGDEVRLLDAIQEDHLKALVVALIDTGARLSELLNADFKDVRVDSLMLIDTKSTTGTYKARSVPLTGRARDAMDYLVQSDLPSPSVLSKALRAYTDMLGIEATFHTLRHTCASRLLNGGARLTQVRDWLGHSSVTTTERYAHLESSSLSSLKDLL